MFKDFPAHRWTRLLGLGLALHASVAHGQPVVQGLPSDAGLERIIAHALRQDPRFSEGEISKVAVRGGQATLEGNVDDVFEKQSAEAIARSVVGVTGVDNRLGISEGDPDAQERALADKVKALFKEGGVAAGSRVEVRVEEDVVSLFGTVRTKSQWLNASVLAQRAGASRVINNLRITG